MYSPSYLELHRTGELALRADTLSEIASSCRLCPHRCEVSRREGETGTCRSPYEAVVSSAFAHFGEETPLVGSRGSGTIFFCGCNLRCSFCQNWEISHGGGGRRVNASGLAELMVGLQRQGCHNINLVTPTHYTHVIVGALELAVDRGLNLPLVYNCGGYESVEVLRLLEGVIDIYMPDVKFFDDKAAVSFLSCGDYGTHARQALAEMHRQVGELRLAPTGVAYRGLLVRHLVLPDGLGGTGKWAGWIARNLSAETYVNIMDQYRPCHQAGEDPRTARRPTAEELAAAREQALAAGLTGRGFVSEL